MATYCVKVTWVENENPKNAACIGNDETAIIVAESEEAATEESLDNHRGHYESDLARYHPEAEIIGWCVAGKEDDGPWEPVQDGFRTKEEAIAWLAENHAGEEAKDYGSFYVDYDTNQGYADLFARRVDGELRWELASGMEVCL